MSDSLQCCTQVIHESLNKVVSSAEASSSRFELDHDKLVPVKDLVDAKKRMLATLKKKQAEFAKRVSLPGQRDRQASTCTASVMISYHRHLFRLLA